VTEEVNIENNVLSDRIITDQTIVKSLKIFLILYAKHRSRIIYDE
jgi:hypothetical protein